jgi:hypothetical protein
MKSYPLPAFFGALELTVYTEGDDLCIKTSFLQYAICLFSCCRVVTISKRGEIVEIKTKKWWRWERPLRLPFSKIDYFDLTYPEAPKRGEDNKGEIYELYLITKDASKKVSLFTFGSADSSSSAHQKMAEGCADLIAKFSSIRFGLYKHFDMPLSDFKDKYICKACGHQLHPDSQSAVCLYCGGKEIRIE